KGTLLLERKAAGTISGYYRERVEGKDKRIYLGTLNRKPRSGTDELTLDAMRLAALRLSQTALEAGGLEHVKLSAAKQLHSSGEGSFGE
ncbi:integrase, partial [Pseudomonas aeruginosa]